MTAIRSSFIRVFLFCTLICASSVHSWAQGLRSSDVVYGVVPPFFGKKPFQSVIQKLDELKDLGVDILWISPVNETDDIGAISYSVTDHLRLREDFGTEAEFRQLVKEAHARGMKVILDFVPNHTSHAHRFYEDALERGPLSPYYNYYERTADGAPKYYFDWDHLPNLNYRHSPVVEMIESAFEHWVREYDIDGYRVDVAWGVKERAPKFWPKLRKKLERIKPDVIMLAEAGARDRYYVENGFDFAYDWSHEVGEWAWADVFVGPKGISGRLHNALTAGGSAPSKIARFLNNNDTGKRFITRYGIEWTLVASVLQHTLPGIPIVYTGDEVGAEYEPYEDPEPISWKDPYGLRAHYKKLSELREELKALKSHHWIPLKTDSKGSVYAYLRGAPEESQVLVVLNFGSGIRLPLEVSDSFFKQRSHLKMKDRMSDRIYEIRSSMSGKKKYIDVPERSALILQPLPLYLAR